MRVTSFRSTPQGDVPFNDHLDEFFIDGVWWQSIAKSGEFVLYALYPEGEPYDYDDVRYAIVDRVSAPAAIASSHGMLPLPSCSSLYFPSYGSAINLFQSLCKQ